MSLGRGSLFSSWHFWLASVAVCLVAVMTHLHDREQVRGQLLEAARHEIQAAYGHAASLLEARLDGLDRTAGWLAAPFMDEVPGSLQEHLDAASVQVEAVLVLDREGRLLDSAGDLPVAATPDDRLEQELLLKQLALQCRNLHPCRGPVALALEGPEGQGMILGWLEEVTWSRNEPAQGDDLHPEEIRNANPSQEGAEEGAESVESVEIADAAILMAVELLDGRDMDELSRRIGAEVLLTDMQGRLVGLMDKDVSGLDMAVVADSREPGPSRIAFSGNDGLAVASGPLWEGPASPGVVVVQVVRGEALLKTLALSRAVSVALAGLLAVSALLLLLRRQVLKPMASLRRRCLATLPENHMLTRVPLARSPGVNHAATELAWATQVVERLGKQAARGLAAEGDLIRVEARSRKLERLINRSPAVFFIWKREPSWPVSYVSENVRSFGYTPEDFTGNRVPYASIIHPDDVERVAREVELYTAEDRASFRQEYRILTSDGDVRWTDDATWTVHGGDGSIIAYEGVVLDVTERKQMVMQLRENSRFLKSVFNAIQDGIRVLDKECRVLHVNRTIEEWYGPAANLLGCRIDGQPDEQDGGGRASPSIRALRSMQVEHGEETVDIDGRTVTLELSAFPIKDGQGELFGVVEHLRDVSLRHVQEENLRIAHANVSTLVGSISAILVAVNGDDRIEHWNMPAEEALGLKASRVLGQRFSELALEWDWDRVLEAAWRCRNRRETVSLDSVRYQRARGGEGILGMTFNPVLSKSKRMPGLLILAKDITESKAAEERASFDQRLQSIGQLAAGVAHEINTPVQYVNYNMSFLEQAFGDMIGAMVLAEELARQAMDRGDEGLASMAGDVLDALGEADLPYLREEVPESISHSLKGLTQVTDIVGTLKQLSHPGGQPKTPVDVNTVVRNAVTVSRNEWKSVAEMELDLAPGLPSVLGLTSELSQAILNLVVNASQAVAKGRRPGKELGRIHIATRHLQDEEGQPGMVEVQVADNGHGIPEEIQHKVFEPFFTTKDVGEGTGQGLALARTVICELHGGDMDFESGPEDGTRFFIRLPALVIEESGDTVLQEDLLEE